MNEPTLGELLITAMRSAQAEAWEEGQRAGWDEAQEILEQFGALGNFDKHYPNPYRDEGGTE